MNSSGSDEFKPHSLFPADPETVAQIDGSRSRHPSQSSRGWEGKPDRPSVHEDLGFSRPIPRPAVEQTEIVDNVRSLPTPEPQEQASTAPKTDQQSEVELTGLALARKAVEQLEHKYKPL